MDNLGPIDNYLFGKKIINDEQRVNDLYKMFNNLDNSDKLV